MDAIHALPPPIWVDTPAGVQAMLDRLRREAALAVDTESNSLYVYRERVCLIQISVPGVDYLVDPLALPDLSGLGPLLADERILKVLHGAEYDLSVLHRDFGFVVANLFDTMWASRILGWPEHGLAALIRAHFGVALDKKYQRANWGVRPLPSAQLDYARLDSHFLLPLQRIQARALDAAGRWPQARHRFAALAQTRWVPKQFDPEGFWKLPGVRDLDDAGRGALCALYSRREEWAAAENKPPFMLLSNRALVALSERRPDSVQALRRMRGLSKRCLDRYGPRLVQAIHEGSRRPLAWEQRPRSGAGSGQRGRGRPSARCQARYEALRTWRNAVAERRGVEPDIILTNEALWAVAYRCPRERVDLSRGGLLAPWQVEEFGTELLAVLRAIE